MTSFTTWRLSICGEYRRVPASVLADYGLLDAWLRDERVSVAREAPKTREARRVEATASEPVANRRGIKFRTVAVELASREHVMLWIELNQLGRRNLPEDQRTAIGISAHER